MNSGRIFPLRFIADSSFIIDLFKNSDMAIEVIEKLSKIHMNSIQSMNHNLVSDECFKESIKTKVMRGAVLLGAFHPVPFPEYVCGSKRKESKIIRWAVNVANKQPWEIIILTSEENAKRYFANRHYTDEINAAIKISYGDEALRIINLLSDF
jgi:hypothetical protein